MNNDPRLFQKAAAGDKLAYTQMLQPHLPRLAEFLHRYTRHSIQDNRDIIQEVCIKVWERRENLVNIKSLEAYLIAIAKNIVVNLAKREKAMKSRDLAYHERTADSVLDPVKVLQNKQLAAIVRNAVDSLTDALKDAFWLSSFEGLSSEEIAIRLGISTDAARKRVYLARKKIEKYLGDPGDLIILLILLSLWWKVGLA